MKPFCAAIPLATTLQAGPIVLVAFSTTITRSGYINGGFEPLGPPLGW